MHRQTVALVGADYEENLSLRYLSAALAAAGFDAEILAFNTSDDLPAVIDRILAVDPIVVGISVPFQLRARELLSLAAGLRARGFGGHVVAGGHFATFEYQNILRDFPDIDSVVRHEGEEPLAWICGRVRDGLPVDAGPGVVVREDGEVTAGPAHGLPPLDTLPFPDRRGRSRRVLGVASASLVGSRGCYGDCSFCCIHAWGRAARGPRYRRRSPEYIVEEMYALYTARGVRIFVFHDDTFLLPTLRHNLERYEHLRDLLTARGMTDIGLVIKCRPDVVHPELFDLLKSIGLIRAYVGIETNSGEGIVSLNRRVTPEDNRRALRVLRDLDVFHTFNVLIFDPEATLVGVRANLDFMAGHADVPFNFCRAEVYAGTPLERILESQGRLTGNYLAWDYRMRDPRVELLFRVATTAFNRRNFDPAGVHNINMGIRFDLEVLRRFHTHAWSCEFNERVTTLSREIGTDSVDHMRHALDFCRTCDIGDARAAKTFALEMARSVAASDLRFVGVIQEIRRSINASIESQPDITIGGVR